MQNVSFKGIDHMFKTRNDYFTFQKMKTHN